MFVLPSHKALGFPLNSASAASWGFCCLYFFISSNSKYFLLVLSFPFWLMDYSEVCFLTPKHMGGFLWFILWWLMSPEVLILWHQGQAPVDHSWSCGRNGPPHHRFPFYTPCSGNVCFSVVQMKELRWKILPNVPQLVCWIVVMERGWVSSPAQLPRCWSPTWPPPTLHFTVTRRCEQGSCGVSRGMEFCAVTTRWAPAPAVLQTPLHSLPRTSFH